MPRTVQYLFCDDYCEELSKVSFNTLQYYVCLNNYHGLWRTNSKTCLKTCLPRVNLLNFISRVYCLASPMQRLLRERSVESGHMLPNFSELKSGGDNSYAVPPTLKSGGGRVPPVPHRSTPVTVRRAYSFSFMISNCILMFYDVWNNGYFHK